MNTTRRTFLLACAGAGAVSLMPGIAAANALKSTRRVLLLTGLDTDNGFAAGTGIATRLTLAMDAAGYHQLSNRLTEYRGNQFVALLDMRGAFLVEQVFRDTGVVAHTRTLLSSPPGDASRWAWDIGRQLATGGSITPASPFQGSRLVALSARI